MKTPLEQLVQHAHTWMGCTRCELSRTRNRVVIGRGVVPCDILMIGEAPGNTEDILGQPFVGEAGRKLQEQVIDPVFSKYPTLTYAMTNMISCIPIHENGKDKPTEEEIENCSDRLQEFVDIAKPRAVICVGADARKYFSKVVAFAHPERVFDIVHPAWIIRKQIAFQPTEFHKCRLVLMDAIDSLVGAQHEDRG